MCVYVALLPRDDSPHLTLNGVGGGGGVVVVAVVVEVKLHFYNRNVNGAYRESSPTLSVTYISIYTFHLHTHTTRNMGVCSYIHTFVYMYIIF